MEEEAGQERGGDEAFVLPGEEILEVTRGGLDKESKTSGEEYSMITLRQGGWGGEYRDGVKHLHHLGQPEDDTTALHCLGPRDPRHGCLHSPVYSKRRKRMCSMQFIMVEPLLAVEDGHLGKHHPWGLIKGK